MEREQILKIMGSVYPFYQRDPGQLELILTHAQELDFSPGETILEQGSAAGALYLIIDGHVELHQDANRLVSVLEQGDIFGHEMLGLNSFYRATAKAMTGTAVLCFSQARLEEIAALAPDFHASLLLMYTSSRLAQRTHLAWLPNDEAIAFIGRRHAAILAFKLLAPFVLGLVGLPLVGRWALSAGGLSALAVFALAVFIELFWLVWVVVDWSNDYSVVTNQRVVFQERVVLIYDSRQEAPLGAVLAVTTDTGQVGRWLGYGDVTVRTYAGTITLPALSQPDEVAGLINAELSRAAQLHSQAEQREMRAALNKKLHLQPAEDEKGYQKPVQPTVQPGVFQRMMANLVQMRFEKGDTITYRTHWLFLFLRTLPPFAVLAALSVLLAGSMAVWNPLVSGSGYLTVLIIFWVLALLWFWYQYADWRNDYYVITQDQILDVYKKPLGREEKKAAPIKNIQSVRFARLGIIGLIFNFGTVSIKVGDVDLTFDQVYNPSEIQQILLNRIAEIAYREKQSVLEENREMVSDFLTIYHDVTRNPETGRPASGLDPENR